MSYLLSDPQYANCTRLSEVMGNVSHDSVNRFLEREDFEPIDMFNEVKDSLEKAYCMSVHRAQGSEWDNVIIAVPSSKKMVDRNMIYTSFSRCRKRAIIVYHDHGFVERQIARPPAHVRRKSIFLQEVLDD